MQDDYPEFSFSGDNLFTTIGQLFSKDDGITLKVDDVDSDINPFDQLRVASEQVSSEIARALEIEDN